jgi:hypothetical protein
VGWEWGLGLGDVAREQHGQKTLNTTRSKQAYQSESRASWYQYDGCLA